MSSIDENSPPAPDASAATHVAVRLEKLRKIEALGIDPWGGRFDGHIPIEQILAMPADLPEAERPKVRAAGRIISRRGAGKLFFLDIWDASGKPVLRSIKSKLEGKEHEPTEYLDSSSRVQVMLGQKQIGEQGWALAQELDLGDLIGVDGNFGKTQDGRADHLRRQG